jgi:hypothetical protein
MLGMHCEQQLQQHVWDQLYLQQTMPYETIIADYMKCLQGNRELEVCDVCITVKSEVQHQACQYDDVPCPMSCTTSSAMQAVQLHRVWRSSKAACNGHCCRLRCRSEAWYRECGHMPELAGMLYAGVGAACCLQPSSITMPAAAALCTPCQSLLAPISARRHNFTWHHYSRAVRLQAQTCVV